MRPKKHPEVAWRLEKGLYEIAWEKARRGEDFEEIGVVTLLRAGAIHQLNLVGAEIWTRINGVNTVERIAAAVAFLFDADPEAVLSDVKEFVRDIEEKGWIRPAGESGSAASRWTSG